VECWGKSIFYFKNGEIEKICVSFLKPIEDLGMGKNYLTLMSKRDEYNIRL
jgi:hypothetical protein